MSAISLLLARPGFLGFSALAPLVPDLLGRLPRLGEHAGLCGWLGGLLPPLQRDDGVLHAAPKKRTSHRKKRQRQLSGRYQQHPLRNLNRCPACGHYKRAHTLCMHCVSEIRAVWRARDKEAKAASAQSARIELGDAEKEFMFPERDARLPEKVRKLRDTESYVLKRSRTLPVPDKRSGDARSG